MRFARTARTLGLAALLVLSSLGHLLRDDRSVPLHCSLPRMPPALLRGARRKPPPLEPDDPTNPAQLPEHPPRAAPDQDLFASLYDQHADRLRAHLSRLGVPPGIRDDLVQEAFTRAWAARAQLRDRAALTTWLNRIAQRCWFDWLRTQQLEQRAFARVLREACPRAAENWSADALLIEQALATLRDQDREILYLRWEAELGFEEIADLLSISPAAAQRRAHRALVRLRHALAGLDRTGDPGGTPAPS
ncbi:RNA polymerase sigma factor [Thermomicrobium sp.]